MDLTEAQTRAALINPQLEAAQWKLSDRTQVSFEVPASGKIATPLPKYGDQPAGITDFCLYDEDGCVLAVGEAA